MSRIVAIVGRPNVGKSTLFNRLVGERKAIVDDYSGVTRDRHYGECEWGGLKFSVIDTGGYVPDSKDVFESAIRDQVKIAVQEANLLLFMVDVQTDVTDLDTQFANILRKSKKPVILVVNKVDNHEQINDAAVFYSLGFGELYSISSATGSGTGDLLDKIVELLPVDEDEQDFINSETMNLAKIAIVGRPNVGKSSFVNALLGYDRNIVTDIAGTTRDSIHTRYNAFGKDLILIDTAGIRKKSKVDENIEFYSVMRSLRAIENCDVCILMLDANQGIEAQDLNLLFLAHRNGKGIVVLVNKWDTYEKETNTAKEYEAHIRNRTMPFVDYPILFISALNKQRIFQAMETAVEVESNLSNKVKTSKLNEIMLPIVSNTSPPSVKGKTISIKYIQQLPSKSVCFAFFCNLPQYIGESYKRFLENQLRQHFNFKGVPIKIFFRKK
ncbi:MAG: ribosome biogenesis GTPase Der [Bacteroidetes bacterium]|nr:ribosome biogenesis GTPase Der [Bacteroidota bacterium]